MREERGEGKEGGRDKKREEEEGRKEERKLTTPGRWLSLPKLHTLHNIFYYDSPVFPMAL